jgi:hypothetical protein
LTAFDGGFEFSRAGDNDPSISLHTSLTSLGHIATGFSPNLVGYATLHANGRVSLQTMTADPTSPLLSAVLAQKFTYALKKNGTFDDIYLLAEQYLTEGPPPTSNLPRLCNEIVTADTAIHGFTV